MKEEDVGTVIGDLLPLAIGVAISPVPIIAVILMLLSPRPGPTSVGFLLGWILGIVVVTTVVLLLVGHASNTDTGPSTVSSVIKLVLGALLVLIGVRQWTHRPKEGDTATMPKWMSAIDSFTFAKAAGLGALLSGINPKNLIMCLGAGTTIGAAHLSAGGNVVAVVIFTVLASCTIAVPVIVYLSARERMAAPLTSLRTWLTANNAAMMAVLVLVIGVTLIGKGIGGLSS
jgi:threonine/homoserine/homoserine lactone efflux protein